MIFFKNFKLHDISISGKAAATFPGFQGSPGAVGTLKSRYHKVQRLIEVFLFELPAKLDKLFSNAVICDKVNITHI